MTTSLPYMIGWSLNVAWLDFCLSLSQTKYCTGQSHSVATRRMSQATTPDQLRRTDESIGADRSPSSGLRPFPEEFF